MSYKTNALKTVSLHLALPYLFYPGTALDPLPPSFSNLALSDKLKFGRRKILAVPDAESLSVHNSMDITFTDDLTLQGDFKFDLWALLKGWRDGLVAHAI